MSAAKMSTPPVDEEKKRKQSDEDPKNKRKQPMSGSSANPNDTASTAAAALKEAIGSKSGLNATIEELDLSKTQISTGLTSTALDNGRYRIEAHMMVELDNLDQAAKAVSVLRTKLPKAYVSGFGEKTGVLQKLFQFEILTTDPPKVKVFCECMEVPRGAIMTLDHYADLLSSNVTKHNADDKQLNDLAFKKRIVHVGAEKKRNNGANVQNEYMLRMLDMGAIGLKNIVAVLWQSNDSGITHRFFWSSKEHEMEAYGGIFHRRYVCPKESDADETIRLYRRAGIYVTEYVGATNAAAPVYGALGAPPDLA